MDDESNTATLDARSADPAETEAVRFETRIVVILRDDLAGWQRANATAFLVSGIAAGDPNTVGEPYEDGSGYRYLPMFREPAYVYMARGDHLIRAANRARERAIPFALFTDELFSTGHDGANRDAVRAVPTGDLSLVGIAFRADRKVADRITKGLRFHP